MTVSSDLNRITYAGNGTTTVFAVNYYFLENSHLQVVLISSAGVETVQTLTTNYTVSGAGNEAGGSITMLVAPPTGTTLVIQRNVPATQETDYLANDPFPAESHERALDKLTMLVQQNERNIDRALKIPLSAVGSTSTDLPIPVGNKLLAWNSDASAVTNFDPSDVITIVGQQTSYGDVFTGNGSTTNFTLTRSPGSVFGLDVSINGVTQVPNVDYILSGTTLSFTTAPPAAASQILARYAEVYQEVDADAQNVRYLPAGSGAQLTNVQAKLRETVSVKDFGAVGDGVTDDTAAIQAAIDYVATIGSGSVGGIVYVPKGEYRITSTIISAPSGGQVGIRGAGQFATIFKPDGDFTAIWLRSAYVSSGDFSVEWSATAAGAIPTTRIGVEFAGPNNQMAYVTIENITVMYAYRGFTQRNWTGQPLGNIFLSTLRQLTAFRCADWGFYFDSKVGSTTLRLLHCYVRGDDFGGTGAYGKGIFCNNFDDIYTEQLAIDQCLNQWVYMVNGNVLVMNGTALEANEITNASNVAMELNIGNVMLNGLKDIACVYDTGANARLVFFAGNCRSGIVSGYAEQASTVGGGTTKYVVALNAATTKVNIADRSVVPSQVLDSGFFANTVFEGRRLSSTGLAPSYGTWLRGDNVLNGLPSIGQPKGWVCTVAGSPGSWVSEGNL